MTASSHDSEPALPPGPPDFSSVEGNPRPHHSGSQPPGASTVPGAGPNPTAADDVSEDDTDRATPGASNVPGAGPNPDPGR